MITLKSSASVVLASTVEFSTQAKATVALLQTL